MYIFYLPSSCTAPAWGCILVLLRCLSVFPRGNKVDQLSVYLEAPEAPFTPLHLCPRAAFRLTLVSFKNPARNSHKGEGVSNGDMLGAPLAAYRMLACSQQLSMQSRMLSLGNSCLTFATFGLSALHAPWARAGC